MKPAIALVFAGLIPVSAATIQAKYEGYYGGTVKMSTNSGGSYATVGGGIFFFERTGGTYNDGPAIGEDYYAMCIEPWEWISSGATHTWNVQTLPQGNTFGTFSTAKVDLLSELFGRYWPDFDVLLSPKQEALALQIAVWEIVGETSGTFNLTGGVMRFKDASIANTISRASTMLSSLDGTGPKAQGLMVMEKRGVQDYVFQITTTPPQEVPEPTHLLGIGLAALALLKRRLG